MNRFLRDERALDAMMAEMYRIVEETLAERRALKEPSPSCGGPYTEIFSIERPFPGPTGIRLCLVCDRVYDPTFKESM
jgi:hypothetical protein